MFVEGAKNGNYRSVSIAHSLRGAFFLGGAAPAVAGAGYKSLYFDIEMTDMAKKPSANVSSMSYTDTNNYISF